MALFSSRSNSRPPTPGPSSFYNKANRDLVLANRGSVAWPWPWPCSLGWSILMGFSCSALLNCGEISSSACSLTFRTDEIIKVLLSSTNCLCPAYTASCVGKIPSTMWCAIATHPHLLPASWFPRNCILGMDVVKLGEIEQFSGPIQRVVPIVERQVLVQSWISELGVESRRKAKCSYHFSGG